MSEAPEPLAKLNGPDTNFHLGPNKKVVIEPALALKPYAGQPESFRRAVSQELWDGLGKAERMHLVAIYNKMQTYRLWDGHVTKVVGIKEKSESDKHALCLPGTHPTDSSADGFVIEVKDHDALYKDIFKVGFGTDTGPEATLHGGQTSTRESTSGQVTNEMAAPDGLHISLGPGNRFDAHVDKVSPTNPAEGGRTQMDVHRGWLHHRRERVWPDLHRKAAEYVAKKTGIEVPGVDISIAGTAGGPSLEQPRVPMPEDRNNPAPPIMVDVTMRIGGK